MTDVIDRIAEDVDVPDSGLTVTPDPSNNHVIFADESEPEAWITADRDSVVMWPKEHC